MKSIEQTRRERLLLLVEGYASQAAFARAIGRSPSQLNQWIRGAKDSKSGKPRGMDDETARYIERCAGKPNAWLDQPLSDSELHDGAVAYGQSAGFGQSAPYAQGASYAQGEQVYAGMEEAHSFAGEAESSQAAQAMAGFAGMRQKRVPIISWVRAGSFSEITDVYPKGTAEEWTGVRESRASDNAFALRVNGDSMTSPYMGERSFPHGTVIIVDPNRAATAGDFVVAKDVATQEATFKRLAYDGGRWFLKPLNPSYPTIEIDDPAIRVIGRVIEMQFVEKL